MMPEKSPAEWFKEQVKQLNKNFEKAPKELSTKELSNGLEILNKELATHNVAALDDMLKALASTHDSINSGVYDKINGVLNSLIISKTQEMLGDYYKLYRAVTEVITSEDIFCGELLLIVKGAATNYSYGNFVYINRGGRLVKINAEISPKENEERAKNTTDFPYYSSGIPPEDPLRVPYDKIIKAQTFSSFTPESFLKDTQDIISKICSTIETTIISAEHQKYFIAAALDKEQVEKRGVPNSLAMSLIQRMPRYEILIKAILDEAKKLKGKLEGKKEKPRGSEIAKMEAIISQLTITYFNIKYATTHFNNSIAIKDFFSNDVAMIDLFNKFKILVSQDKTLTSRIVLTIRTQQPEDIAEALLANGLTEEIEIAKAIIAYNITKSPEDIAKALFANGLIKEIERTKTIITSNVVKLPEYIAKALFANDPEKIEKAKGIIANYITTSQADIAKALFTNGLIKETESAETIITKIITEESENIAKVLFIAQINKKAEAIKQEYYYSLIKDPNLRKIIQGAIEEETKLHAAKMTTFEYVMEKIRALIFGQTRSITYSLIQQLNNAYEKGNVVEMKGCLLKLGLDDEPLQRILETKPIIEILSEKDAPPYGKILSDNQVKIVCSEKFAASVAATITTAIKTKQPDGILQTLATYGVYIAYDKAEAIKRMHYCNLISDKELKAQMLGMPYPHAKHRGTVLGRLIEKATALLYGYRSTTQYFINQLETAYNAKDAKKMAQCLWRLDLNSEQIGATLKQLKIGDENKIATILKETGIPLYYELEQADQKAHDDRQAVYLASLNIEQKKMDYLKNYLKTSHVDIKASNVDFMTWIKAKIFNPTDITLYLIKQFNAAYDAGKRTRNFEDAKKYSLLLGLPPLLIYDIEAKMEWGKAAKESEEENAKELEPVRERSKSFPQTVKNIPGRERSKSAPAILKALEEGQKMPNPIEEKELAQVQPAPQPKIVVTPAPTLSDTIFYLSKQLLQLCAEGNQEKIATFLLQTLLYESNKVPEIMKSLGPSIKPQPHAQIPPPPAPSPQSMPRG